jgi:hypothetical protein
MNRTGYRCAPAPLCTLALGLACALNTGSAMGVVTGPLITEATAFAGSLNPSKRVDFNTAADAFGLELGSGSVGRLGLKFSAIGRISNDSDVEIVQQRLSVLFSDSSLHSITIDLGQSVTAFGALLKLPDPTQNVTLTLGGQAFRLTDVPGLGGGGTAFAAFTSTQPFNTVTFSILSDGRQRGSEYLLIDDVTFGNIPAPGAGALSLVAAGGLVVRRRRRGADANR